MKTIHKHGLVAGIDMSISTFEGAEIIHVGEQYGVLYAWFEVLTTNKNANVRVSVYGTGDSMNYDGRKHRGSVQMSDGLVWHVYQ